MTDYFAKAVQIAKAHEAKRKAERDAPCHCTEYDFPHRKGGGCCRGEEFSGERSEAELNAERLALFDAEEARHINKSGAW